MGRALRAASAPALLIVLALAWRGQWAWQYGTPRSAGGWLVLAAVAALFAVWAIAAPGAPAAQDGDVPTSAAEWLAAGALCVLGLVFRVVHFSSVPGGMNHDAAFNGMYALHVLQGAPYTPYVSAAWGRETLFMYLCTPLVAWLGNVPEAIQLAATLVGIATLPLFYVLARAMLGPRPALIALAFLAVSGWHGVFSRVGWRMIMVPPFEIVALLGSWRALRRDWWRDWLLAGTGAALAIYTYDAGRVVAPMLAVLVAAFTLRAPRTWRRHALGGLAAALAFVAVGAPMLGYVATHFEQFTGRAAHLASEHAAAHASLASSAAVAAAMFNYRGNGNDFFVNEPLLEPLAGALFAFGVLVLLRRVSRPVHLFILVGLAMALLPGVLSVPNGNRCIAALPFVYLIIGMAATALADAVAAAAPPRFRDGVAIALVAVLIAAAAVETYREYLGDSRRRILGFSPEATAAGEYLRRFGGDYARYVVSEDWQEYTLAYLSYNGGGTPLENHYVLGRRFDDIDARINRYGRRGMVFVTDLKPAGRQALERLERLFAAHRVEPVPAVRLGGRPVGAAVIVEPQGAARSGLWSNITRALAVGGDEPADAVRCFDPIGDGAGVSVRLQLMRPHGGVDPAGEVRWLDRCPPRGRAPLAVGFGPSGLEVRGEHAVTAVAAAAIEPGRWYDVTASLRADGTFAVVVDGEPVVTDGRLAAGASTPPRIAGFELLAPAGGQLFVDDLLVLPGGVAPEDERWARARHGEITNAFAEDLEATPYGLLAADAQWRKVVGPVSALTSPANGEEREAAEAEAGGSAFDGGRGAAPGQFTEPIGIAATSEGNFYVADKGNHRVQEFRRDGSFVRTWGQQGDRPGEFREPHDVAADDEFVYVADLWNQRVQVFDHAGAPVFIITGAPSLSSPRGLFVKDRLIYIAEAAGGRVTVYDRAGALRQTFGVAGGDAPGHLIEPVDVAVDVRGEVWVINSGNNRIEHFAPDGTPRGAIPIAGWTGPRLKEVALAIDAQGTLYVGDWDRGAVRRFRPDGAELPSLGSGLRQPAGIALERDRVLVVSRADDVVRVLPR